MSKAVVSVVVVIIIISISASCVESAEIRLISPIGAVTRSIIPGWGQVYTNHKFKGAVVFLSIALFSAGGIQSDIRYRDIYKTYSDYANSVGNDPIQADGYYDRANQYYKLSRFLLYTAAGVWAYSIIDAYVDANIYNARQQAEMLRIDDDKLRQLKHEDSLFSF